MKRLNTLIIALSFMVAHNISATELPTDSLNSTPVIQDSTLYIQKEEDKILSDSMNILFDGLVAAEADRIKRNTIPSIYTKPYSLTLNIPKWKRLWVNTAVLAGTFVSTLFVLECLPEDATSWNRASLQKDPPLKRWYNNVFKRGPEWDHDKIIFNYVLHPYAGAVYFMSARTCGFNYWRSLLYCTCVSTIGWEYGIEACMERPSIQDLFITPIIGSLFGEGFYRAKRHIVSHDYSLLGSKIIGNAVVFLIDPVNEVIDLFRGSPERRLHLGRKTILDSAELADLPRPTDRSASLQSSFMPCIPGCVAGFSINVTF
ncbi:MAG: DUF3943 domain-containing protein [Muribaculum sp.]|nr:DUF3943 domain-containing protein [Muribaculum sp.]